MNLPRFNYLWYPRMSGLLIQYGGMMIHCGHAASDSYTTIGDPEKLAPL